MKIKQNILQLKKYWQILYAILLIVLIPVAIIANTVWITHSFRQNIDIQLQRQALALAEVFNGAVEKDVSSPELLQEALERVAFRNEDIRLAEIMVPEGENFMIVASLEPENIGKVVKDLENVIAWHQQQAIAKLTNAANIARGDPLAIRKFDDLQERFWVVTIPLFDGDGQKQALLNLKMSVSVVDTLVAQTLIRSYLILAVAVIIVMMLLVANTRLFQYAVLAKRLKEVEQLKDEFISMASHELRTPITSLRGYLSLLEEGSLGELTSLAREKVAMMLSSADRLSEMVEDLLNVSRIEQGRLSISFEKLDIVPTVEAVVNELSVQAQSKRLKFVYEKPAQALPKMLIDEKRLKQVLINIVGNAIKYTPKGSVIVTSVYKPDERIVEIKCADTGLGMTAKEREKLFQKFYRVKTKDTETIKGTGLGLWITKQLIELMQGEILVDSIKGVGSQFTLNFPVRSEKEMEALLAKQAQRIKEEAGEMQVSRQIPKEEETEEKEKE